MTKYTEESRTLAQAAAVFKVNIDTLIGLRKRNRGNRRRENENPPAGQQENHS